MNGDIQATGEDRILKNDLNVMYTKIPKLLLVQALIILIILQFSEILSPLFTVGSYYGKTQNSNRYENSDIYQNSPPVVCFLHDSSSKSRNKMIRKTLPC